MQFKKEVDMPEHYVDRTDWREQIYLWVTFIIILPIAIIMGAILRERKR